MLLAALAIAALATWAIWQERDRARRRRNLALILLIGAGFLLLRGNWVIAGLLGAGAAFVQAQGRLARVPPRQALPDDLAARLADARALLGVSATAGVDEINAAHRRLIARNHPDAGGTQALASRINAARDLLLANKDGL